MPSPDPIAALVPEMTTWRRELHARPELATVDFVAGKLGSFGLSVAQGRAKTGVDGTLHGARPGPAIALRADLDALPIQERGDVPHRSVWDGRMHACGHDGHVAMLLGAAH